MHLWSEIIQNLITGDLRCHKLAFHLVKDKKELSYYYYITPKEKTRLCLPQYKLIDTDGAVAVVNMIRDFVPEYSTQEQWEWGDKALPYLRNSFKAKKL